MRGVLGGPGVATVSGGGPATSLPPQINKKTPPDEFGGDGGAAPGRNTGPWMRLQVQTPLPAPPTASITPNTHRKSSSRVVNRGRKGNTTPQIEKQRQRGKHIYTPRPPDNSEDKIITKIVRKIMHSGSRVRADTPFPQNTQGNPTDNKIKQQPPPANASRLISNKLAPVFLGGWRGWVSLCVSVCEVFSCFIFPMPDASPPASGGKETKQEKKNKKRKKKKKPWKLVVIVVGPASYQGPGLGAERGFGVPWASGTGFPWQLSWERARLRVFPGKWGRV